MASIAQIREQVKALVRSHYPEFYFEQYIPRTIPTPGFFLMLDPEKKSGEAQTMGVGWVCYRFLLGVAFQNIEPDMTAPTLDSVLDYSNPHSLPNLFTAKDPLGLEDTEVWFEGFRGYGGSYKDAGEGLVGAQLLLRIETNPRKGT